MWWLDIHIHCEVITKIKIINTYVTSPNIFGEWVVRMPKIYLCNFQVYNIVLLTVVTVLYMSIGIYSSYKWKFVVWLISPNFPCPLALGNHHSILCFYSNGFFFFFFRFYICLTHNLCINICLSLAYFT